MINGSKRKAVATGPAPQLISSAIVLNSTTSNVFDYETSGVTVAAGDFMVVIAHLRRNTNSATAVVLDHATFGTAGRTQGTGTALTGPGGSVTVFSQTGTVKPASFIAGLFANATGTVQFRLNAAIGAQAALVEIQVWRNIDPTAPVVGAMVTAVAASSTDDGVTISRTTTAANAVLVGGVSGGNGGIAITTTGGTRTGAAETAASSTSDISCVFGYIAAPTPASVSLAWTWTDQPGLAVAAELKAA